MVELVLNQQIIADTAKADIYFVRLSRISLQFSVVKHINALPLFKHHILFDFVS